MKTGTAHLPLHGGAAPRWLFERMVLLSREFVSIMVSEFGPGVLLERLADPYWFQALGCVLGFDWHSSGVTTTTCGALKEATRGLEADLGFFIAGGKGRTSRKTPQELVQFGERFGFDPAPLVYASKMSAKVDNTALQDGYQLYHHTFLATERGNWAVVQQGMNGSARWARRYHWLSSHVADFVCEPEYAVCSDQRGETLNLVAHESGTARQCSAELAREQPEKTVKDLSRLQESLDLPQRHAVLLSDVDPRHLYKILERTYERQPHNFEALLAIEGVGPKSIRALALLSELVYGAKASVRDPARFSFAHGGKDGHPYPVDRATYDRSIAILRDAIRRAKLGNREKLEAFRRLSAFEEPQPSLPPSP